MKSNKSKAKAVVAGGSATGGGINFQAAVTAIAEVYVAVGAKLDWLRGIAHDIPIVVLAETGGAGDDIAVQFGDGTRAEVQVKKGLSAGNTMWEAVIKIATAVNNGTVDYGILVVCPNSSGTIRNELARDLERLAGGRSDGLKSITNTFVKKLEDAGLSVGKVAKRFRIITMNCLVNDNAAIQAAKSWLVSICESADEADRAWNALYLDGAKLIEFRGARAADSVAQVLRSEGIALKTGSNMPSLLLDSLCRWTMSTTTSFSIPGISQSLPIDDAWVELNSLVVSEANKVPTGIAEALEHYHSWYKSGRRRDENIVKSGTLGRFMRRCVLVGGPGMGKSTLLKKLARSYANDGFPVIHFAARILAQRIRSTGCSFEEGIVALGADGSGLTLSAQTLALGSQWVVLCDGLDEAGSDQESVCEGLLRFAAGYPMSRIVVTTRPVGYGSSLLKMWRHYELQPLGEDDVERHVERLIRVVTKNLGSQEDALRFAKVQIDRNQNARLAARSPLILGLITALSVQGVPFGDTKVQLYERLFSQMERSKNHSGIDGALSSTVLAAYLDILAWEILHNPTATVAALNVRCGEYLSEALSEPTLKARAMAEKCFNHWERVGMIEKVNHAGIEAATFIHKTFCEYAAARHLTNMPKEEAHKIVNAKFDDREWSEVMMFASSLGLADIVLEARIMASDNLAYEVVDKALTIMAVSEAKPSALLKNIVFKAASKYLNSPIAREAISTGAHLIKLVNKYPQEVAGAAESYIDSEQPCTKLAARTLMTFSGTINHDDSELKGLVVDLPSLVEEVWGKLFRRGAFDFDANPSTLLDVIYAFSFRETLKRVPYEEAGKILSPLCVDHRSTLGGLMVLLKIVEEYHRPDLAEQLNRPMKEAWKLPDGLFSMPDFMDPLLLALKLQLPPFDSDKPLEESALLWQLSGFMAATGYMKQPVRETWPDKIKPDDVAIQEILHGCIIASGVDPITLSLETVSVLNAHGQSKERLSGLVFGHLIDLDNEIEWGRAKGMNLVKLELAMHYPSNWAMQSAANLILVNATPDELAAIVRRLFEAGKGDTLWAASQLCLQLQEPTNIRLILDRLEMPLVAGCQHLYSALALVMPPLDERLLRILRNALVVYDGPITATNAAKVAEGYVVESSEVASLLQESFDLWRSKEKPYPVGGGVIPESPRELLLKGLLMRNDFDKVRLLRYASDTRSDVAKIASDALLRALHAGELRDEFLAGLDKGDLSPRHLASALGQNVPFTESQLQKICGFLGRSESDLQRAAMAVLRNGYMSADEVRVRAQALEVDPDPEIRERARRLLQA